MGDLPNSWLNQAGTAWMWAGFTHALLKHLAGSGYFKGYYKGYYKG